MVNTQDLHDLQKPTEELVDHLIARFRDAGEIEHLEDHFRHDLENGSPLMVKAAVLRIVISRLLEAKRQQIGGNSELLSAPIPEAADWTRSCATARL